MRAHCPHKTLMPANLSPREVRHQPPRPKMMCRTFGRTKSTTCVPCYFFLHSPSSPSPLPKTLTFRSGLFGKCQRSRVLQKSVRNGNQYPQQVYDLDNTAFFILDLGVRVQMRRAQGLRRLRNLYRAPADPRAGTSMSEPTQHGKLHVHAL